MDNTVFDDDFYSPDFPELQGYIPPEKRAVALFPTIRQENITASSADLPPQHAPAARN